jgi:hypothetical protein
MEASILPIVPKDSAVKQIFDSVGVDCFSHDETTRIADHIVKCMDGYKPTINNKTQYSWVELSKRFDFLLREIIEKKSKPVS